MTEFHTLTVVAVVAAALAFGFALRSIAAGTRMMPKEGEMAPHFTLPNERATPVSLSSLRGKWVVLYFYPKDMTSGCTIEAHNFQRDLEKYAALNAEIVGVSVDSVKSHEKFCAKGKLHFTLLSDHGEMKVSKDYGVLANLMGFKMNKRVTFLIDPEGKIAKAWTGVNPMIHSKQVLAELERRNG